MPGPLLKLVCVFIAFALVREAIKWWRRVQLSGESRSWPSVEGRIERSEVSLETGAYRQSRPRSGVYVPLVEFVYQVAGREYTADVITFGKEPLYTSFAGRAQQKCNEYRPGSTALVFFDPESPSTACLERGAGSLGLGYLVAILIAALGVLALAGVVLY